MAAMRFCVLAIQKIAWPCINLQVFLLWENVCHAFLLVGYSTLQAGLEKLHLCLATNQFPREHKQYVTTSTQMKMNTKISKTYSDGSACVCLQRGQWNATWQCLQCHSERLNISEMEAEKTLGFSKRREAKRKHLSTNRIVRSEYDCEP